MNEDEVGDIIRFGIEHPAVRSIAFQPVTHSGRHVEFDPLTRLTNSDIIHRIAEQAPELVPHRRLLPGAVLLPHLPRRSATCLVDEGNVAADHPPGRTPRSTSTTSPTG